MVALFVAGPAGCAAGFALFPEYTLRQWPVTTRYIDRDSARTRQGGLEGRRE